MKASCALKAESVMVSSFVDGTGGENPLQCGSYTDDNAEISSKIGSWGGARPNSGGARENSGGRRAGSGRKPRVVEQSVAPPSPAIASGLRWYGVETEFRAEYDVFAALARLSFRCHLPRFVDHTRRHKLNPRAPVIALVIPGFLFVEFDRSGLEWRRITSETGVKRLLGPTSENPTAARVGEVERLIAMGRAGDGVIDDDATPFPTGRIREGQEVRIGEGPFADFIGICTWSDKRRLQLIVDIFGRSSTIHLRHNQVCPV